MDALLDNLSAGGCLMAAVAVVLVVLLVSLFAGKSSNIGRSKSAGIWASTRPIQAAQRPPAEIIAAVRSRATTQPSSPEWTDLLFAVDALCDLYLVADETTREQIRESLADASELLLDYTSLSALKLVQQPAREDQEIVYRRGVTAAIIENLRREWRESHVALRELYETAQGRRLEPVKILHEMAALAGSESPYPEIGGHPSMRIFLTNLAKQFRREVGE